MASLAPGCFGLPSVFSFKPSGCSSCIHFEECRYEVVRELSSVPQTEAIIGALIEHDRFTSNTGSPVGAVEGRSDKQPRPSRARQSNFAINQTQQALIKSVPSGVGKELSKLYRRGMDILILRALNGEGHFFSKCRDASLRLAIFMLKTGFTKVEFKRALVTHRGWSASSAWSKTSLVWTLLKSLGVAIESDDRLIVHPNLFDQNNNSQN